MMPSPNSGGASDATAQSQADGCMFLTRLATSAVFAPIALGAVYFGFPAFNILVALMAAAVLWEYVQIVEKSGLSTRIVIAIAATLSAVGVAHVSFTLAVAVIGIVWAFLFVFDGSGRRFKNTSTQAALICAAIPPVCLVMVAEIGGATTLFWLLAVVWGTDVGAYALGRMIGGPRLAPVTSPNKTWSGAVGGVVTSVFAAGLTAQWLGLGLNSVTLMLAASLSIAGQAGDMAESQFKRRHGVKDSGTWMPGHGGVMDRVDGLWTIAPIVTLICAVQDGGIGTW